MTTLKLSFFDSGQRVIRLKKTDLTYIGRSDIGDRYLAIIPDELPAEYTKLGWQRAELKLSLTNWNSAIGPRPSYYGMAIDVPTGATPPTKWPCQVNWYGWEYDKLIITDVQKTLVDDRGNLHDYAPGAIRLEIIDIPNDLITQAEAADLAAVSVAAINNAIRDGRLRNYRQDDAAVHKPGGNLVSKSDVAKLWPGSTAAD